MAFLKTRGNFEAFQPKMGLNRTFSAEIWTIEVWHFFWKKVENLETLSSSKG